MGYYTKNNKRGGNVVSGINNAVTLFQFIFCILFIGIIFIIIDTINKEKFINSPVNRRVLFGEAWPEDGENYDFTVAVAKELEDRVQQGLELGKNIANEIKEEPVIMNPINQAIFYDAEEFDLPELRDDEPYNVESYLVDTLARPAQDLKKGVINFFKNKNNQISTVDE